MVILICSLASCGNKTIDSNCPNCGEKNLSEASFCNKCGASLNNEESSSNDTSNKEHSSETTSVPNASNPSSSTITTSSETQDSSEKPHSHNYTLVDTRDATCQNSGYKKYKCTGCNDDYTETYTATNHNFNDATCNTAKKCKMCGVVEGNPIGCTTDYAICQRCGRVMFFPQEYSFEFDGNRNPINGPDMYENLSFPKGKYEVRIYYDSRLGYEENTIFFTPFGIFGVNNRKLFVQTVELEKPVTTGRLFMSYGAYDKIQIKVTAVG